MDNRVNVTLDDDLYDYVTERAEQTGRTKSKLVNDHIRDAREYRKMVEQAERQTELIQQVKNQTDNGTPSLGDTILPMFGQGLFFAGFVLAFFMTFTAGLGTSIIGLVLVAITEADEYAKTHDVAYKTAFIRVLGA